ncbi:MAG TPA: GNAT family N-acetyltransferase [Phycisphaerae bacterium]|nr:GNAT family N-acetyltransferase [Phycisphaerae bacterium]HRY67737.1 GNAT family N-acetyltransferase [Phycisphaerae bacterium]HSA25189.1 GNAT family N-acetyltransferase [Phycisphaerae bacterium]
MNPPNDTIEYRYATKEDCPTLGLLNCRLIEDEGHRNTMTVAELEQRMAGWLEGEYKAIIFSRAGIVLGYGLYRREPEWYYLRQFFVDRDYRRQGIGRAAVKWLTEHAWQDAPRLRVEVLVGNTPGIAFWHAVGFTDYCLTLEQPIVMSNAKPCFASRLPGSAAKPKLS